MKTIFEKIRDNQLEIDQKLTRKDEIIKLLREKRDSITQSELTASQREADEIDTELRELRLRKMELKQEALTEQLNARDILESLTGERDSTGTMEYRKAFMEYVQRGTANSILQTRADATTTTTTAATVIPVTLMKEIIKTLSVQGNILSRVRKMNMKGGVDIPVLSTIPTATWVTETTPSDRQALTTTKISFSYYMVEARISQTLLSEIVSIDEFEAEFVTMISEALINKKEIAIFNGTGSGQPTGILATASAVTKYPLKVSALSFQELVKFKAKIPLAYRKNLIWTMAGDTWALIEALVDSNGQPIARTTYGIAGEISHALLGSPVELVEVDRIIDAASAATGAAYIVLGDFSKYGINGNGSVAIRRWVDEDKNENVIKGIEVLDGKVLQASAFIQMTKVAES